MMKTDVPAAVACRWRGLQICSGCGARTDDGAMVLEKKKGMEEKRNGTRRRFGGEKWLLAVGKTRQIAF